MTSWNRPKPRLIRTRAPSRTARFAFACSPLTSTLPPSQARLASERVLKRQATSSQTSSRCESTMSDEDLDLALRAETVHERRRLLLAVLRFEILLDPRLGLVERDGPARLLLEHLDDVKAEVGFDQVADGTGLEAEGHFVELRHHLPLLEEAEVAAVRRTARILGVGLGQCREVLARLD